MPDITAEEALERLVKGNLEYQESDEVYSDVSKEVMNKMRRKQDPFAIVIACSDSRVVPEKIFNTEIGDIFVIQGAGNVVGPVALGSVEFATGYLDAKLIVVLGHSGCGAIRVAMALEGPAPDFITKTIKEAIGDEKDKDRAAKLNVINSMEEIISSDVVKKAAERGVRVVCGYYRVNLGTVEFLSKRSLKRFRPNLDASLYVDL